MQNSAQRLTTAAEAGTVIRAVRKTSELTQAEMATRLGLTRQRLIALEQGADGIAAGTLLAVLADLGVVLLAHLPPARPEAEMPP